MHSCPQIPNMLPGVVTVSSVGAKSAKSYFSNYGSFVHVRLHCSLGFGAHTHGSDSVNMLPDVAIPIGAGGIKSYGSCVEVRLHC